MAFANSPKHTEVERQLHLHVLRVDRTALLRYNALSQAEQLAIALEPEGYLRKACVAVLTPYPSVIAQLSKSDDDAVKLALSLNENLTPEAIPLILCKSPLTGHFMGEYNYSVSAIRLGNHGGLGMFPIVVAKPIFDCVEEDDLFGFELIEGMVPLKK